jgi:hypothetical protein
LNPAPLKNKISSLIRFVLAQPQEWQDQLSIMLQKVRVIYGQNLMGEGTKNEITQTQNKSGEWDCTYTGIPGKISCYAQTITYKYKDTLYLLINNPEKDEAPKCYHDSEEVLLEDCFNTKPTDPPLA